MKTTRVKIVGIGLRKKGIGKSGSPYDFVEVTFTYPCKKYDGVGVGTCSIDGADLDEYKLTPGCAVEAFVLYKSNPENQYDKKPYIAGITRRV